MTIKPKTFYTGVIFTVECAIKANGASESYDFIRNLDNLQKAKITALIKRFADHGRISNKEQFKKVEGDLWEFKNYQTRVIMYYSGKGQITLTNGFIKKTDKIPKSEIDRAYRIKEENEIVKKKGGRHEQRNYL
jgi:phage-related protein